LIDILHNAEFDHGVLQAAAVQFDRLPTLVQRRVIATLGAVTWPRRRAP
jgi:hypothetical protein